MLAFVISFSILTFFMLTFFGICIFYVDISHFSILISFSIFWYLPYNSSLKMNFLSHKERSTPKIDIFYVRGYYGGDRTKI